MPKWVEKISKYNPGEKSLKTPFAIYLDLECLSRKEQISIKNIPKNLTQRKKLDMSLLVGQCLQDVNLIKKKLNLIITEEKIVLKNIKKLCKKLKEHAMEIVSYEEKEMIPLTYEENKSYKEQKACHICEEKFCKEKDDENYTIRKKVKEHCYYTGKFRGVAHSRYNLNYKAL